MRDAWTSLLPHTLVAPRWLAPHARWRALQEGEDALLEAAAVTGGEETDNPTVQREVVVWTPVPTVRELTCRALYIAAQQIRKARPHIRDLGPPRLMICDGPPGQSTQRLSMTMLYQEFLGLLEAVDVILINDHCGIASIALQLDLDYTFVARVIDKGVALGRYEMMDNMIHLTPAYRQWLLQP